MNETKRERYIRILSGLGGADISAEACKEIVELLKEQPEPTFEQIKEYCDRRCMTIITNDLYHHLTTAYSAPPEIKPIGYNDCSNAMMKMWMDNVVTDGEYNRIMDKLNAYWRSKDG